MTQNMLTGYSLNRRRLLAALALSPLAGFAARNAGAAAPAMKLSSDDQADLKRVATYLDGIHTMRARFQQVAAGGGLSQGKIYLRRPGLMRVEYEPPVPVLLVADGLWVNYYDRH